MPTPTIKDGPNQGEGRKRGKGEGEGDAQPPRLRKKRGDAGSTHGKAEAANQRRAEPRSSHDLEDYDEDKP